jgi:hypothetical protein
MRSQGRPGYARRVDELTRDRQALRAKLVGPRYLGWAHFAFTSLGSLLVIALAISRVHRVRPLEWLTLPVAFLVANAAEYFGHKGPMHHRTRGLGLVFQRHTLEHHRFFTDRAMAYEGTRDFKLVLFPPVMLLFFLGAIATPLGLAAFFLFGATVGWLFVAVAMGYFLSYEWLHFSYHLPIAHPLARLPAIAALRRHHTVHHDPRRMAAYHFNITFPIFDWLLKTRVPKSDAVAPSDTSSLSADENHAPLPERGNSRGRS